MSVTFPEGVVAQGNEKVLFVVTIAVPTAPTVAELTAAGVVDLSCYLRGFEPTAEQAAIQDLRLCSAETFETPGRVVNTINDLLYVYDPQDANEVSPDPGNLAYHALAQNVEAFVVDRRGIASGTAVIAAQVVDLYPVKMGLQRRVAINPGDEGTKFEITQKAFITGPVLRDISVVA